MNKPESCACRALGMNPAMCENQCDHPGGSLNTEPSFFAPRIVTPRALLALDDDTPLTGGHCGLDGPCESCQ